MERLINFFTPKNYNLSLKIDKHKKTREGKVVVFGESKAKTIKFHCVGTEVDYVKKNDKNVDFELKDGVLSLSGAPNSNETIEIGFHGSLNENMQGAYLSTYKYKNTEKKIVSTQFESHYARECFPCIDEPAAKAVFELSITIPETDKDVVISNMPVKNVVCFPGGNDEENLFSSRDRRRKSGASALQLTTFFEPTPRMSTYLLAFVIGEFKSKTIKNQHGVEITTYVPLNQREETIDFANEVAAKSLDYYDDLFKTPYPLKKLDQVAIPDFEAGAMENWGLVIYRESCLLADENSSLDTKKSVAVTISHELSHQWFGNLVTMEWWNDLWLNESFASVMEYYAIDSIFPEYNIWEDFFTGSCLSALRRDSLFGVQAVKQEVEDPAEIATLFDSAIVYAKGAHLMLMLIRLMGEKKFFKGIEKYFEKHAYKNTVGDDLWKSLQPFADFDVKDFMHAWISQPGYPVLTDGIAQRFLITGESDDTSWPLPKITDDMSGHYLLNLSGPEFDESLKDFVNLSLEQRLRLLIDRMLLAKTPIVASASLLDLLPKFKNETSPAIWEILISIISDLKIFFTPGSETEKKFKNFLIDLTMPNLMRLGVSPRPNESDEDTRLRSLLLAVVTYSENVMILESLAELYDDNLEKIHPEIRDAVLFAKMKLNEAEIFPVFLKKYQEVSDPEQKFSLLYVITAAKNPENIETVVGLLNSPEIVKPQDHLYLYIYLLRNHKIKDLTLDWLFENWEYVEKMTGEKSIEDYPRYTAGAIKTKEDADKFFNFFERKKENPILKRTLKIAEKEIKARLDLIETDKKALENRLK